MGLCWVSCSRSCDSVNPLSKDIPRHMTKKEQPKKCLTKLEQVHS